MSYRIYRTRAIVLRSYPYREADRTFALYTEDFGLIYVRAQGVRHERSRLRYALCNLSFAKIALVRGKAGWRLTGAVADSGAPRERSALLAQARIASLISRLVGGEEANQYLFDTIIGARDLLMAGGDPELIEIVSVSRILHTLGYVAPESVDGNIFQPIYEISTLESARTTVPRLVARINKALAETQL